MNLSIKPSIRMSSLKSPLGNIEDNLIRIPKHMREEYNYPTGSFLKFKSKDGKHILLQVTHAYKDDTDIDNESIYVSDSTYELLDTSTNNLIDPAEDILIGCDPEFFLVDRITGNSISASNFFPHCGQVGSDAGLAELRPRPSMDVAELTENIKKLISEASIYIDKRVSYKNRPISMIAASTHNGAAAGFHIHFGLPKELLTNTKEAIMFIYKIVYLLDYYIGIASIIPEGNDDFQRRSSGYGMYGKPADFRSDGITLEYRVPGGHLLRHPVLTMGLFALSKIAMKDIMSRLKIYTDEFKNLESLKKYNTLKEMYPNLLDRNIVYLAITNQNVLKAVECITKIYEDYTKMVGYAQCEPYIKAYFDYIINYFNKGVKYSNNIQQNWRY